MKVCKCGIAALDCEYHRPAPQEQPKKEVGYWMQWEELDQHGNVIIKRAPWILLKDPTH